MSESEHGRSERPSQDGVPGEVNPEIAAHEQELAETVEEYAGRGLTRRQITARVGASSLLLGSFATVLAACGSKDDPKDVASAATTTSSSSKKLKMFASNGGLIPTWYAQGMQAQKHYCDMLGIDYTYADGQLDANAQRQKIENAANKKWDIVHIDANAPGTLETPVKKMIAGGAVVFEGPGQITQPDKDTAGVTSWMRQSSFDMGYQVATTLFEAIGGKGKVIETMGPAGVAPVIARHQGFQQAVKENPGIEVIASDYGNWDPKKVQTLWESYVSRYPTIDAGYCQNDDMAFAALKVLQGANRASKTKLGGCDAMPPAIKAVASGQFQATYRHSAIRVHCYPIILGRAVALGAIDKSKIPRITYIDGPLLTKDNASGVDFLQDPAVLLI
jgi:ribose transport system substrate-binding protein